MKYWDETVDREEQLEARRRLIKLQARHDPVCAESLAAESLLTGGAAFIPTMLDYDDDLEDWRPF